MTHGAPGTAAPPAPAPVDASRDAPPPRRTVSVDVLFSPYVVALALWVPLLVLFLATPARVFDETFATTKYASGEGVVFYWLAIAAFVAGALVGDVLARGPVERERTLPRQLVGRLRTILAASLVVAVAAYALWLALALYRAGGLAGFVDAVRSDPEFVRHGLFATVPGITTLTQVALAAVPLAIAYRLVDRRLLAPLVGIAVVLALTISVLGSIRLMFLELAVALAYLLLGRRRSTVARVVAIGVGIVAVAAAFFILAELRRRVPYEAYSVSDGMLRFFSYYVNSVNNAMAIVENHTFALPLFFSTQAFWEFPGVGIVLRYEDVFNADSVLFHDHFHRANGLSRSVTTFTLPGEVHLELGWASLWLVLGLGGVAGALYRSARRDPFYRAVYAVWLVGMFEFMRHYYFLEPRMMPTYALFALVFLLVVRPARRARAPAEGPP